MAANTISRRRILKGMTAAAAGAAQFGSLSQALAQDTVPRNRTLIIGGMSEGPTWNNPTNANYYAPGVDLRNGLMFASEALFWYNPLDGKLIPWLAESYSYNKDFTTLTVKIRKGAAWSDGQPFTARDVAFTYNMLIENGQTKKNLRRAVDVARRVKRATASDDLTAVIELNWPDPRHLYAFPTSHYAHGLFWVPEHVWKSVEDKASFTFFDLAKGWPLTTSAWKVVRGTPNDVVLDRRPDWWAAKTKFHPLPEVQRLVVVPPGARDRVSQLLVTNQIDTAADIQDPMLLREIMKRNPKITSFSGVESPLGNLDWWPTSLYFNSADAQWNDKRVRHAINRAVNAFQITQITSSGINEVNLTPYPAFKPLIPYVEEASKIARRKKVGDYDLAASQQLMESAGFKRDDIGFWAKDGKRVGGAIHGIPALNQIGPIVQQQLRKAGFDVTFFATPDSRRIMMAGQTPLMLFGHNGGSILDPLPTLEMYHTKNRAAVGTATFNMARFSNPQFDAAVDAIAAMRPEDPGVMEKFRQAMEVWYDELPEVPIQQWYHRIPMNTTYWTNWPSQKDPYMLPAVNFESTPVYLTYKLKAVR
jgi:peptide/nickel transport system substrate-binding protein